MDSLETRFDNERIEDMKLCKLSIVEMQVCNELPTVFRKRSCQQAAVMHLIFGMQGSI